MKLTSVLVWLSAVIFGASLGPAQAASLIIDDFDSLSTPPAGNQWNQSGAPVLGGVREFTKIGGTWGPGTGLQNGSLRYTSTGSITPGSSRLELRYDSVNGSTGWFNPLRDMSGFSAHGGWLIVRGTFRASGSTTAVASISWQNSGGGFTESTATLTGAPGICGFYRFRITSFSSPILDMSKVGRIWVRLNNLAEGDSFVERIYFGDYLSACIPEPSTLALAGLAAFSLVIARRKR